MTTNAEQAFCFVKWRPYLELFGGHKGAEISLGGRGPWIQFEPPLQHQGSLKSGLSIVKHFFHDKKILKFQDIFRDMKAHKHAEK